MRHAVCCMRFAACCSLWAAHLRSMPTVASRTSCCRFSGTYTDIFFTAIGICVGVCRASQTVPPAPAQTNPNLAGSSCGGMRPSHGMSLRARACVRARVRACSERCGACTWHCHEQRPGDGRCTARRVASAGHMHWSSRGTLRYQEHLRYQEYAKVPGAPEVPEHPKAPESLRYQSTLRYQEYPSVPYRELHEPATGGAGTSAKATDEAELREIQVVVLEPAVLRFLGIRLQVQMRTNRLAHCGLYMHERRRARRTSPWAETDTETRTALRDKR